MTPEKKAAIARLLALRADKKDDVWFLAHVIDGLGPNARPIFAAAIIDCGLMIPRSKILRFALWFNAKRRRSSFGGLMKGFETFPHMLDEIMEQTAEHVAFGKDETAITSVGGWNQDEMNLAVNALVNIAMMGEQA